MSPYQLVDGDRSQRKVVADALIGLGLVPADLREKVITAWTTSWLNSPHQSFLDLPYAPILPKYRLTDHVNDVTRIGLALAERAAADWGDSYDADTLLTIFLLHDVDKPLIYARNPDGSVSSSLLGRQLPHGVLGAMLLKDLGFSYEIVSTVATHAGDAPFHGETFYDYVLYYADMFSADHVTRMFKYKPFYQKK